MSVLISIGRRGLGAPPALHGPKHNYATIDKVPRVKGLIHK